MSEKKIVLDDSVYGKEVINEKVLIDLINSDSVQRLKGISQFGFPEKYYYSKIFSRYDHSIGTLILLRRMGADLYEQIAGLLHDVSHTAFSHVVDYVLKNTNESYQDKIFLEFIFNTEIPEIIKENNLDIDKILNFDNYSLLENDLPNICADRLYYSLREMNLSKINVKGVLLSLINYQNEIIFNNIKEAKFFSFEYMKMNKFRWTGKQYRMRYHLLSNILKKSFDKGIINFEDLKYKADMEIIDKLLETQEEEILEVFDLFEKSFEVDYSDDGIVLPQKFRYVDPKVIVNGNVNKLSELDSEYKEILEKEKKSLELNRKIKIIEK